MVPLVFVQAKKKAKEVCDSFSKAKVRNGLLRKLIELWRPKKDFLAILGMDFNTKVNIDLESETTNKVLDPSTEFLNRRALGTANLPPVFNSENWLLRISRRAVSDLKFH